MKSNFLVVRIVFIQGKCSKHILSIHNSFVAAGQSMLKESLRSGSVFMRDGNTGKRYSMNEVQEQFYLAA